jgi:hypothetical protein
VLPAVSSGQPSARRGAQVAAIFGRACKCHRTRSATGPGRERDIGPRPAMPSLRGIRAGRSVVSRLSQRRCASEPAPVPARVPLDTAQDETAGLEVRSLLLGGSSEVVSDDRCQRNRIACHCIARDGRSGSHCMCRIHSPLGPPLIGTILLGTGRPDLNRLVGLLLIW